MFKIRVVTNPKSVDAAIEISQINAELEALNARVKHLEQRRKDLVSRIGSKYGNAFQFYDSRERLFQIEFTPRQRRILNQSRAIQRLEQNNIPVPMTTSHWVETYVRQLQEES